MVEYIHSEEKYLFPGKVSWSHLVDMSSLVKELTNGL